MTKAGASTVQVYSPAGQLLYQRSPAADGIFRDGFNGPDNYPPDTGGARRYIYLGRHLLAEDGNNGRLYHHTDALGSPTRTTTTTGTVSTRNFYQPYGWGPVQTSVPGFAGHVADAETGLSYMQARYYDPYAGRFLSVDPVAAGSGSFNRYWYANNNPYRFVDPDGRQSRENVQRRSTGIPFLDWLVTPRDARSSAGEMMEKQFSAELSQPHSAKDVALYVGIAMSAGTLAPGRGLILRKAVAGDAGALLSEAVVARNALAAELAPLKGKGPPTITAGFNTRTGEIAARACGGGRCAETHVVEALGGNKDEVKFTPAMRPRTGAEVPICERCEAEYGRDAFPPGTLFKSDQ